MKCSLIGLLRLKPFDESEENPRAGAIYAESTFFTLAILASSFLAITALALAFTGSNHSIEVMAGAVGISAVTAGFEWHAGLKAKALNQLCTVVVASLLFGVLGS